MKTILMGIGFMAQQRHEVTLRTQRRKPFREKLENSDVCRGQVWNKLLCWGMQGTVLMKFDLTNV